MRKLLLALVLGFTALGVASLVFALVGATFAPTTPAAADVDDFAYDSWQVDYVIDLDAEGRAVAQVTETLVPRFPETDQNRGIVRALPLRYQGAPAAPEGVSVRDASGAPVPFEIEDEDGFRLILVGDDDYVHGAQHYVIAYTLRDVILAVPGGDGANDPRATGPEPARDEFYWNLLPQQRLQQIGEFTARIHFEQSLADRLTRASACYAGPYGSSDRCELFGETLAGVGAGAEFVVPPTPMPGMHGITVAIGLESGSAVQPPERLPNFAYDRLPGILTGGAAALGLVGAVGIAGMRRRKRTARGTIIAQYEVAPELPPLLAGPIVGAARSTLAAEFVHLAVCGATRIEEVERVGKKKPKLAFRLLDPARAADPLDQRALRAIFGKDAAPGTEFALPRRSEKFSAKMQKLEAHGKAETDSRGYTTKERSRLARICGALALALITGAIVLLVLGASRDHDGTWIASLLLGVPALILAVVGLARHRVYTRLGAETREHLLGVREFIRVAETDRLRVLQSYTGAERRVDRAADAVDADTGVADAGVVDVVHLYERLLPYAMLFGLEKEWGRALQLHYESAGVASPVWYPAAGAHGIAHLDRTLSDVTRSFTSAASYTSSSSGGSTGGGFSGGGGGGGFSGGR